MEPNTLQTLSTLTPAVAVSVIFAYVLIKSHQETGKMHKEKTEAFLTEIREERSAMLDLVRTHAGTLEKFSVTQQQLTKSIDLNTEATKDMRDALRRT